MDMITGVAVTAHFISAIVAFFAANFTYHYMKRSETFFVVKERTPFFTIGLAGFGVASVFDAISMLAGMEMQLSIGALIRMLALIQIMYGAVVLRTSLEGQETQV